MNTSELENDFKELCKRHGLKSPGVHVQKYNIDNDFYTMHDWVWEDLTREDSYNFEELEVDLDLWFRKDFPTVPAELEITDDVMESVEKTVGDLFPEWYVKDEDGDEITFFEEPGVMQVDDERVPKNVISDLEAWWDEADMFDLFELQEVCDAMGCEYPDDQYSHSEAMEVMAYWTNYFDPRIFDEAAAHDCGLFPFTYKGRELLALGGCGMDLSPKLDCYQAKVAHSLPRDSRVFGDTGYFDCVSAIKHEAILKMCERGGYEVKFTAYIERSDQT